MWEKRDMWDGRPDRLFPLAMGGIVVTFLFASSWYTNGIRMTLVFFLTTLIVGIIALFPALVLITYYRTVNFRNRHKIARLISKALDAGVIDDDIAQYLRRSSGDFSGVLSEFSRYILENEKGDPAALLREWGM